MTTDDEFTQKTAAFVQWLKSRGVVISPKIEIHDYRGESQGRGVIALGDIKLGETLFSIPRASVLAVDTLFDSPTASSTEEGKRIQQLFQNAPEIKSLDPWMSLIFYMMIRAPQPDKSSSQAEYGPYFDVLPQKFSTLMFWEPTEVGELLTGSTVGDRIGKEEAEESFNEVLKPIFETYAKEFDGIDTSVDAFHRMGSLIMSYSFDVDKRKSADAEEDEDEKASDEEEDEKASDEEEDDEEEHQLEEVEVEEEEDDSTVKAMVPLADILNAHTRLCNANLFHESDGTILEMRAIKDIPKGEQVYNTYGDLPNSDLLRRYGYVESGGNAFDVTEISTELVLETVKEYLNKSDKFSYSKKDKSTAIDDTVFEKAMETLAEWQEETGLIGEGSGEGEDGDELQEFVDDSYDISVTGTAPVELQVFINFLTLWSLDHFASKNRKLKIKSVFNHYLKTAKADSSEDKSHKKKLRKKLLRQLVSQARSSTNTESEEEPAPQIFQEAVPIWNCILSARKSDYPTEIVATAEKELVPEQRESVSLTHKDMASELLTSEVRILCHAIDWAEKQGKSKLDSADKYLSTTRKEQDAYEKEREKSQKKKRDSTDTSSGNDKRKKKKR